MKALLTLIVGGFLTLAMIAIADDSTSNTDATNEPAITYAVESSDDGQLIVKETVTIAAAIKDVWQAYTTSKGYAQWAAAAAEVDLRPGGSIRATYRADGDLTGDDIITLHIVNFVPERLLTLKAEVSTNWPEILQRDAKNLYSVVLFESLGPKKTRITSYALGYTDSPELRQMLKFFEQANHGLYKKLIASLEPHQETDSD